MTRLAVGTQRPATLAARTVVTRTVVTRTVAAYVPDPGRPVSEREARPNRGVFLRPDRPAAVETP